MSFHESTIKGRTLTQNLGKEDFSDKPCVVILDRIYEIGEITAPVTEGEFTVQHGFIRLGLKATSRGVC